MGDPTVAEWHAQFVRQASWTRGVRDQLYRRARLLQAERVLDVGCGTGAVTEELAQRTRGQVFGVDIDERMLAFANQHSPGPRYEQGDVLALPYRDQYFDVVTCHFLLLWVADAVQAVRQMVRVLNRQGTLLICAEPDYGGRIDWPDSPIRQWQIDGLRRQGADPLIGRRLQQVLSTTALRVEVGIVPARWHSAAGAGEFEAEWTWLRRDVGPDVDPVRFADAMNQARTAMERGAWLTYVPVFYAVGRI